MISSDFRWQWRLRDLHLGFVKLRLRDQPMPVREVPTNRLVTTAVHRFTARALYSLMRWRGYDRRCDPSLPVILWHGLILDGNHRLARAYCEGLAQVRVVEFRWKA